MALKFDLLADELRTKAVEYLAADIAAKKDHLSTGFIGVSYLLPMLTQGGRQDTAYKLLLQDTFPSWLFSVKHGATTIWERWDGWTPDKGFQDPGMNSFNHYSLGSCGEWMFSSLAGIDTDGPGFKKLIIRPTPGPGITWVKASYDSINGNIATAWKVEAKRFTFNVTIPPNTTATLYLPAKDAAGVTESGKPLANAGGVKFLRMQDSGVEGPPVPAGQQRPDNHPDGRRRAGHHPTHLDGRGLEPRPHPAFLLGRRGIPVDRGARPRLLRGGQWQVRPGQFAGRGGQSGQCLELLLADKDLKVTIQALGWGGGKYRKLSDDISSVAYWYQASPHAPFPPLPSLKDRMIPVLPPPPPQ